VTRALVARAPTRLDFGGGWTDVPPYPEREGGAVCNVAITRYATATVTDGERPATAAGSPSAGDEGLVRAALRRSPLRGVHVQLSSDFPIGAGLGGSSAAGVAIAGALAAFAGAPLAPHPLAALSRHTEVAELGVPGGYQDHYAAAFGGALLLSFDEDVGVERIALSAEGRSALATRGVLVYTGESRISGATISAVIDAYVARERRVVGALARMKGLATQMADALRGDDLDGFGALIDEHWTHQRALHPSITTPRIDAIVEAARRAGALGTKALGASGGGCVFAFAPVGGEERLARAVAPFGERLDYSIDTKGFDVVTMHEAEDSAEQEVGT
jgi:D-glycero-alpha-D-manno-heptose-7-phosphate kinase